MQRRHLLAVGAGTAAALALAGGAAIWWRPARPGGRFSDAARTMLAAVAQAVVHDLLPADAAARAVALQGHVNRVQATVAGMPPTLQGEIDQLFTLLLTPPGRVGLLGLAPGWSEASPQAVRDALQGLRASKLALRQQVFHALRDLTNASYFADPGTWAPLGYPGPREV